MQSAMMDENEVEQVRKLVQDGGKVPADTILRALDTIDGLRRQKSPEAQPFQFLLNGLDPSPENRWARGIEHATRVLASRFNIHLGPFEK